MAARIKRKQLKAKNLAEEVAEGSQKSAPKRVRVRASTGRSRGRPRKKPDGGHGFADVSHPDVPASSSKTPGVVAAAQESASNKIMPSACPRVRVVPLGAKVTVGSDSATPKRGRGRPRGSLGAKRRAVMAV